MSRYLPVYHPPAVRFFAMTPWDELEHSLHGMNRHMREMDQKFNSVFNQFLQLNPRDERGQVSGTRPGFMRGESLVEDAVTTDKDGNRLFKLQYDVSHFKPEDIKLKTSDNKLELTARCEEGDENHKMYREYHRMCTLPEGLDVDTLKSEYSPQGVLTIMAPLPAIEPPRPQESVLPAEPVAIAIDHHK